jgi:hypothetical protein
MELKVPGGYGFASTPVRELDHAVMSGSVNSGQVGTLWSNVELIAEYSGSAVWGFMSADARCAREVIAFEVKPLHIAEAGTPGVRENHATACPTKGSVGRAISPIEDWADVTLFADATDEVTNTTSTCKSSARSSPASTAALSKAQPSSRGTERDRVTGRRSRVSQVPLAWVRPARLSSLLACFVWKGLREAEFDCEETAGVVVVPGLCGVVVGDVVVVALLCTGLGPEYPGCDWLRSELPATATLGSTFIAVAAMMACRFTSRVIARRTETDVVIPLRTLKLSDKIRFEASTVLFVEGSDVKPSSSGEVSHVRSVKEATMGEEVGERGVPPETCTSGIRGVGPHHRGFLASKMERGVALTIS